MQDIIPDALIAAFERHYDCSWDDPALRNERLAWRAAWAEATKPCLLQITEPQAAPAAVAVPDEREAFEQAFIAEKLRLMDCSEPESATHAIRMCHLKRYEDGEYPTLEAYFAWFAWQARAALAGCLSMGPRSLDSHHLGRHIAEVHGSRYQHHLHGPRTWCRPVGITQGGAESVLAPYPSHLRALRHTRIQGLNWLLSPSVQLICTLRNTRSG